MHTSHRLRALGALAVLVGSTLVSSGVAAAPQTQTNLLTNPGFEQGWYKWNNVPEISVPNGWDFWYAPEGTELLVPQDSPWGRPEVVTWLYPAGFAETWFWRNGDHTLKVFGAWRPIWFRLGQTVTGLTPGAEYKFTAPVFPETVAEYVEGGTRGRVFSQEANAGEFLLRARTGDLTFSSGWVDETVAPAWQWTLLSLSFVAQSDTATVEVEVRGRWGLVNNAFFLDELSLVPTGVSEDITPAESETGGGGEAPAAESGSGATGSEPAAEFAPTSTPLANGEVWYTVQGNDTLAVIAYYHDTTADEIKALNGLTGNIIFPGQQLLVKVVEPPTPEEEPTAAEEAAPVEAEATPTPTPVPETGVEESGPAAPVAPDQGEICVVAYDDINGNAADDGEATVVGAHVILINADGPLDSRSSGRSGDQECFQRLAPGAYRVTVLPPTGYRLTTADASDVVLQPSSIITLAFGFSRSESVETSATGRLTSTWIALGAGVLLLLGAAAVGLRLVAARR